MITPANPTRKDLASLPKSKVEITITQDGNVWTLEVPVARVRFDIHMEERLGLDEEYRILPLPPMTPETLLSIHIAPEMEPGQRSAWTITDRTPGVLP